MVRRDTAPSPERVAIMQWTARMGAVTAEALPIAWNVTVASARARLEVGRARGLALAQRPLAQAAGAVYADASRSAQLRLCADSTRAA